jgi:hypothetical protein
LPAPLTSAPAPDEPRNAQDRLVERRAGQAIPWERILVWFMRVLALLWIAKGLGAWALILGVGHPTPLFEARSLGFQATTVYFAVIDLIAGIGVWLTSTWGGVMWLLAVMSHLILAVFFPAIVSSNLVSIGLFVAFITLYLVISWLAASEQ